MNNQTRMREKRAVARCVQRKPDVTMNPHKAVLSLFSVDVRVSAQKTTEGSQAGSVVVSRGWRHLAFTITSSFFTGQCICVFSFFFFRGKDFLYHLQPTESTHLRCINKWLWHIYRAQNHHHSCVLPLQVFGCTSAPLCPPGLASCTASLTDLLAVLLTHLRAFASASPRCLEPAPSPPSPLCQSHLLCQGFSDEPSAPLTDSLAWRVSLFACMTDAVSHESRDVCLSVHWVWCWGH